MISHLIIRIISLNLTYCQATSGNALTGVKVRLMTKQYLIQTTDTMKKTIQLLTTMTILLVCASFTGKDATEYIGTYGVSASDPAEITLILRSDHHFYYQDFSNVHQKIAVNGNWELNGKKVVLTADGAVKKFHHVWTFDANGNVAKSRKGLTFYRLCKID